jgi:hypothetical protein
LVTSITDELDEPAAWAGPATVRIPAAAKAATLAVIATVVRVKALHTRLRMSPSFIFGVH